MNVRRWSPPLIWAGVIFLLTSMPNPPIPRELASKDKIAHFMLYGGFGFFLARAVRQESSFWASILITAIIATAAAGVDEWHQRFIPGRTMDLDDWRADSLGAVAGAMLALAVFRAGRRPNPINEH